MTPAVYLLSSTHDALSLTEAIGSCDLRSNAHNFLQLVFIHSAHYHTLRHINLISLGNDNKLCASI